MNKNKFKKETKSHMLKKNLCSSWLQNHLLNDTTYYSATKISVAKNPFFLNSFPSTFKLLHTRLSEYNNNSKFYISNYFALGFFFLKKQILFHQRKEVERVFSNNQSVGTIYNQLKINILPQTTVSFASKKKNAFGMQNVYYI